MATRTTQKKSSTSKRKKRTTSESPKRVSSTSPRRSRNRKITGLVFFLLAIIIGLAIFEQAGVAGEWLLGVTKFGVGLGAYILPLGFLYFAIQYFRSKDEARTYTARAIAGGFFFVTALGLLETFETTFGEFGGGGALGQLLSGPMMNLFDAALTIIILTLAVIISFMVLFRIKINWDAVWESIVAMFRRPEQEKKKVKVSGETETEIEMDEIQDEPEEEPQPEPKKKSEPTVTGMVGNEPKKKEEKEESIAIDVNAGIPSAYIAPPLSLLPTSKGKPDVGDIKERAEIIQQTLANFGINVTMDEISVGPTVTRYAMDPAKGTKLAKIKGLANELSLALAAHPIRIEAPIPGKSLVGIEVPNTSTSMIGLGSMLDSNEFRNTNKPLLVSLGKGVSGKPYYANIAKMPHMLVAGATGAGKSVTVHNLILSLLYAHGPEHVRFIMVDPKRVELTLYEKIPHLLTPVIKQAKKAILAMKWATQEMDRRYDILEQNKVRDIGSYHESIVKPAYKGLKEGDDASHLPERMPYIVVIIDEMADLMQAYPRELEASIVRLAQMSRAVGIHLILSTQRPSVNVITGLIKANIPTRLALRVSSQVDSRTILDATGAETLLGRGDTLYKGGDMSKPERVQCAFVDEEDIKKISKFIIKNNMANPTDEIDLPDSVDADRSIAGGSFDDDEGDELLPEARRIVIEAGKASTSYIQRKLRIGYSRAARIMDLLEDAGVIGPANGSKPREILVSGEESLEEEPESDMYVPENPDDGLLPDVGDTDEEEVLDEELKEEIEDDEEYEEEYE